MLPSTEYEILIKTSFVNYSLCEREINSCKVKKVCLWQAKYTYEIPLL